MGTRSWASLLAFKAKIGWEADHAEDPYFPLLGLEEPEAHLHPNAQRQVYQQLQEIAGQKIISTHSPYIAAQAGLEELRHFQKKAAETEVNMLNMSQLNGDEKRKIRREVLASKGDLLFAKAIILFEGETEAQVIPIFFREYWGAEAFNLGVVLQSVDGANYKPYLLIAEAMKIPWFILSDYDKRNIISGVNNAMALIGRDPEALYPDVVKLGLPIESYLVSAGYQSDLKAGIFRYHQGTYDSETDQRQKDAKESEIVQYNDEQLIRDLASQDGKVRYPAYWAAEIIKRSDNSAIPPKIRELFDAVNATLFPSQSTEADAIPE
jgi:putative ATP-dependent endonuclease of OLD family